MTRIFLRLYFLIATLKKVAAGAREAFDENI